MPIEEPTSFAEPLGSDSGTAGVPASSMNNGPLALLREALAGSQRDFTTEPLGRSLFLLALPMVLEMAMESVFAVVDIFWVAKLGPDAIAAVGLTESLLTIVYAAAMGLSFAAMATVARRTGEKRSTAAAVAAVQSICLGVGLALAVALVGGFAAPYLLHALGASAGVVTTGSGYTRILMLTNVSIVLIFLINAIFRGVGEATVAMRALWLANGLNLVLDPVLIFGVGPFPAWGIEGAAIATSIGRGTGVLYLLWCLGRSPRLPIVRSMLRVRWQEMKALLAIAKHGVFQMLVTTASWVALMKIMAPFGSDALAGYTISIRIILFALLPSWGMANAAATMVGQNLGAQNPDRAERAVWRAGLYNLIFLGGTGLVFVLFPRQLVGLFSKEPAVLQTGAESLRILASGFFLYAYGMVLVQAFNGAGDTRTPTRINLVAFWIVQLPMAVFLAHVLHWGPKGVAFSVTVAFSLEAVLGAWLFRKGRWRAMVV